MAKPPSDSPVLFDVECESSTIKQGKDGSYKLVMEGVEKVRWATDDAEAEEGYFNARRYAKRFDNYYGKSPDVSAYKTFTQFDGSKEKCKFTVTDVKYNQKSNKLVYDITPKNKKQSDKITGIEGEAQAESTVYFREPTRWIPLWERDGYGRDLTGENLSSADLRHADLRFADLRRAQLDDSLLGGADLKFSDLRFASLTKANLMGTDLRVADLRFSNLMRSDLRLTNMLDADISGADLRWADLTGVLNFNRTINADFAIWWETTCPDGTINNGTEPCYG